MKQKLFILYSDQAYATSSETRYRLVQVKSASCLVSFNSPKNMSTNSSNFVPLTKQKHAQVAIKKTYPVCKKSEKHAQIANVN